MSCGCISAPLRPCTAPADSFCFIVCVVGCGGGGVRVAVLWRGEGGCAVGGVWVGGWAGMYVCMSGCGWV